MTTFDLTGEVALVTGAGRGVGAAIATLLAAHGAAVAVNDLDPRRAEDTVWRIASSGGRALATPGDIADRSQVDAMVATAAAALGDVTILVNNAGVPAEGFSTSAFLATTRADWDRYLDVNLFGTMHCTQAVLGGMSPDRPGRIVSIVSDAGRVGEPFMAPYAAAKAGVMGFTRALAKEVGGEGVTCNCVSLGSIAPDEDADEAIDPRRTARYAVRRLGRSSDVAPAVLWLASAEAAWVTGQTVVVNGGYSMG